MLPPSWCRNILFKNKGLKLKSDSQENITIACTHIARFIKAIVKPVGETGILDQLLHIGKIDKKAHVPVSQSTTDVHLPCF